MDDKTDSKEIRDGETVVVSEGLAQESNLYERRVSSSEWAKYRQTKRGLAPRSVFAQLRPTDSSRAMPLSLL